MDKRDLVHELRRYIRAQRREEPPTRPDSGEPAPPVEAGEPPATGGEEPAASAPSGGTSWSVSTTVQQRQRRLDELTREASGCQLCELSENRSQVVFGDGSVRARVLVVGEAPGAREDEQGLPFVGPAGELLRGGLRKVGLHEEDVYITNTVKCRPPDNRDPRSDELSACRPYLNQQLEFIDPRVVLTLGNFALQYCLGEDRRISRSRGDVYEWKQRTIVPTYHPAYVLRNRGQAQAFLDDLHLASRQIAD